MRLLCSGIEMASVDCDADGPHKSEGAYELAEQLGAQVTQQPEGRWSETGAMRVSKTKLAILETRGTARGSGGADLLDQVTMRKFDRLCLPPVEPLSPMDIKHIRERTRVSQAVFAALLNTSVSTVQKWEVGQKRPTGSALKLLHLVQKRGLEIVA